MIRDGSDGALSGEGGAPLSQVLSEVCLTKRRLQCGSDIAIEVNYDTFGTPTDPVVLLVMGLTSQKVRFPLRFCQRLASEGFFVIRYDNRDVGRSTRAVALRFRYIRSLGKVIWAGLLRILKEWTKPALAVWSLLALRAWRRHRTTQVPRFAFCLIALCVANRHRPKISYTVADMAGDALGLLDALKISKAHLVGYSMGGMISQYIVCHHPERALSLTLISTCSPNAKLMVHPGLRMFLMMALKAGLAYVPGAPRKLRIEGTRNLWMHIASPGQEDSQQELAEQEHARSSQDFDAFLRQVLSILDFCFGDRDWPPSKPKPDSLRTLVIHGLMDNLLPVCHGFELARRMGCKCVVLPSVSHDSFPAAHEDVLEELKVHLRTNYSVDARIARGKS